jgi:P-type Cu+ transporter
MLEVPQADKLSVPLLQPISSSRLKTLILPVKGMTCATCSTRLERMLNKVPGVVKSQVNLASEQAHIDFDIQQITAKQLCQAIEKAGFTVPFEKVELRIGGMTCTACSTRLEKLLSRLPAVQEVTVNFTLERALVKVPIGQANSAALIATIERAGFTAEPLLNLAERQRREETESSVQEQHELVRLLLAALLTLPLALPMLLMLFWVHFTLPASIQFLLATPVQFWIGSNFYKSAYASLRGGMGNMDVLVVLGTTAAWGLSTWNTFIAGASHQLYFEASAMVITLVLLVGHLTIR